MKVTSNSTRSNKMLAVIGAGGNALFFENPTDPNGGCIMISVNGVTFVSGDLNFIASEPYRKPVYLGDTVTIEF